MLRKYIRTLTPKFHYMKKAMGNRPFTLLDIGSGNFSPSKTVNLFPDCTYHGLDLNYSYSYTESDIQALQRFYEKDLTKLEFDDIPDNHYDYINMAHIIEHLHNGDEVLVKLLPKLKPGGYIYIEYPGQRSTKLPSMYGTLNFHDDPTHVRVYSTKEIGNVLKTHDCTVISSGQRQSWAYILFTPFHILSFALRGKKIPGAVFWDLLGFAEYVFARKAK